MRDDLETQLHIAAERRILARRDQLLSEAAMVRAQQAKLSAREREIEREMAECRAAAKFFGIAFETPPDGRDMARLRSMIVHYEHRASEARARGDAEELARSIQRAERYRAELLTIQRALEGQVRHAVPVIEATVEPVTQAPQAPPAPKAKVPRVRDVVLDQLREAGADGQKASPIKHYIETTYGSSLHDKTVGMTLYRLLKENLVHRKGQTWFYGPQVGSDPPASSEDPGVAAPGEASEVG